MNDRMTDAQLRAAAARRPNYATYPEYRPGQPERLAPYWRGGEHAAPAIPDPGRGLSPVARVMAGLDARAPRPVGLLESALPMSDLEAAALRDAIKAKVAEGLKLAVLPPSPVFEFQPHRSSGRPWWRPRWNWAVMPAKGPTAWGYCWTEAGARRRTARATRKAERRG